MVLFNTYLPHFGVLYTGQEALSRDVVPLAPICYVVVLTVVFIIIILFNFLAAVLSHFPFCSWLVFGGQLFECESLVGLSLKILRLVELLLLVVQIHFLIVGLVGLIFDETGSVIASALFIIFGPVALGLIGVDIVLFVFVFVVIPLLGFLNTLRFNGAYLPTLCASLTF